MIIVNLPDEYRDKINYFNELGNYWDESVGNDSTRKDYIRNVFKLISIKEGDIVVDIGCGNGVLFDIIEEYIRDTGIIYAIDAAPAMIERASLRHGKYKNIRYITGLIENADLPDGSFDIVFCFAVFPHIEDKIETLSRMRSLMKNTGKIYIFHPSDTKSLNDFHGKLDAPVKFDMLPDKKEMYDLTARSGLRILNYIDRPGLNFMELGLRENF